MPVRVGKETSIWAGSSDMCIVGCKGECGQIRFWNGELVKFLQEHWSPRFLLELRKAKEEWTSNQGEKSRSSPNVRTHISFVWRGAKLIGKWEMDSADGLLLFKRVGREMWVPVGRFNKQGDVMVEENETKKNRYYRLIWLRGIRVLKDETIRVVR